MAADASGRPPGESAGAAFLRLAFIPPPPPPASLPPRPPSPSLTIPFLLIKLAPANRLVYPFVLKQVAQICEVAPMRVYEVATFYTMFNREKVGKYFIQLCGTTPCMICGSNEIRRTIEDHLGIANGETTKDGLFTLLEVECLGACANAPMVQLNDDFYENLTAESTVELLEACKAGAPPPVTKWGSLPMNGQLSCEGPRGKTTLDVIAPPPMRPDDELEPKIDPAQIKNEMYY